MKPSSVRSLLSRNNGPGGAPPRRRSRSDTEAQHQRVFLLSMLVVAGLIAVILGGGAIYEYQIKPNQVLAEVNGHEIKRKDYWQYQSITLYNMSSAYQSFAMQAQGNVQMQQQYLQLAASAEQQRQDIWGSTEVSSVTLNQMIEDRLYLNGAESLGITVTDDQVKEYALNQFAPQDAPLMTPVPSPTMIPERAASATETAEAQATQQAEAMGTFAPTQPASPVASPVSEATPVAGTPEAAASPVTGSPVASPVASPSASPEATTSPADARTSAEAEYELYRDNVFEDAHLNESQYLELWAKPNYVRQLVDTQITNSVPQVAPMVNAQHILVGTEELANQLFEQANGGANFDELAKTNSADTKTAATGGKLGWFTQSEVDPAFGDAAFALQKGQISKPFQTAFGWEIIRVIDRQDARPMSDSQYQDATSQAVEDWLDQQRAASDISNEKPATETPTAAAFEPPAGYPTPVLPTTIPPTPTPATPIIGPVQITPGAIPVGTPGATPAGTPGATPVSGTPTASPVATPAS